MSLAPSRRRVSTFIGALLLGLTLSFFFFSSFSSSSPISSTGHFTRTSSPAGSDEVVRISKSNKSAAGIPHKVWQIFFPRRDTVVSEDMRKSVGSWATVNPDSTYTRFDQQGAETFVRQHFANRPDIVRVYTELQVPILQLDFLRYMILAAEGGVYADTDVFTEKPIKHWVPRNMRKKVRAIVGIEYDKLDDAEIDGAFYYAIQFCQWTIASSKGHPMLQLAVDTTAKAIDNLAKRQQCEVGDLEPTDWDVLNTTGPIMWTNVVFRSLSAASGRNVSTDELTKLEEPKLFGDILVLPIDGFSTGISHSGSGRHGEQALIRHAFKGTWRGMDIDAD